MPTSVVKKYSSRWLPVRSCTYTQRTATSPSPALYHWPVPLTVWTSRRPPPYQATSRWVRVAPGREPSHLVRAVVAVAGEHEPTLSEPMQQHAAQLSEQPRRRLVAA